MPPRQSGRWTGSLCIVGHTLTKLPQSVLSLWRETLHPQASRGTAWVCGCVHARTGWAEMTPRQGLVAQTLHCAASKPSLLPPLPTTSGVPSRGRHSWWSLGPLKDHRAEPCNYMHKDNQINNWWTNTVLWIAVACSLQVLVYFMLFFFLFFIYTSVAQPFPLIFKWTWQACEKGFLGIHWELIISTFTDVTESYFGKRS